LASEIGLVKGDAGSVRGKKKFRGSGSGSYLFAYAAQKKFNNTEIHIAVPAPTK
jgi:hypothetical protein